MYLYSNILGTFVFNQNFQIREKHLFKGEETYNNFLLLQEGKPLDSEKAFLERFKNITNLREKKDEKALEKIREILSGFKKELYEANLALTRSQVRESFSKDLLIIQASGSIDELNKSSNLLVKRLREWYSYVLPEVEEKIEDHGKFAILLLEKKRHELVSSFNVKNSMGNSLEKMDNEAIENLASAVLGLVKEKENKERYLEMLMKDACPNITEVAGFLIGAKLLSIAGSLKNLVMMPSSTIQLLGAEKALFRHMLNKNSKPPKHGLIHEHPLLQKAKKQDKGKAARALADKISLAAKLDYFKGEFMGDKLRKELEERFR